MRTRRGLTIAIIVAGVVALPPTLAASDCPVGTKKIGEKRTATAKEIIVQPVCQRLTRAETQALTDAAVAAFMSRSAAAAAAARKDIVVAPLTPGSATPGLLSGSSSARRTG